MPYESQISFTLDVICPWTYLAKKRLDEALHQFRGSDSSKDVNFTVKYFPYQLYPEASQEGEDKYEWQVAVSVPNPFDAELALTSSRYKRTKYNDSDERMKMYTTLMKAYGTGVGIDFRFDGTVANTLNAHRLIQHYQEEKGPEVADKIISSLYEQYFEQAKHPSAKETLLAAAAAAGIDEGEAKAFVEDESEGLMDVKMLIQEQAGNGVDAVPYVMLEGKRRDITLEGAKEVDDYLKEFEKIVKESK